MKKLKGFAILMSIIMMILFCINSSVLGTEIQPRVAENPEEGEPVVTSETDGVMPISDTGENAPINNIEKDNETTNKDDEEQKVHRGDLYIIGNTTEYVMDQVVDGNVFFLGENLKITGQINGSLFACSSEKIEIAEDGYIACHTFAFADTIELNGITYDAYIACANFKMGDNSAINRDLRGTAENIHLSGTIGRNALISAEKITITDKVNGLHIRGNLIYSAKEEIENIDRAVIIGEKKFNQKTEIRIQDTVESYVWSLAGVIVFNIVIYMILMFIAPEFVKKSKEYVSTRSLLAFGIGVAFTIAVPILAIIILFTIVGMRFIIYNDICIWCSINAKCISSFSNCK